EIIRVAEPWKTRQEGLPVKFQRELDLPWIVGPVPQAGDLPESRLVAKVQEARARVSKLRRIGQIEKLGAKLQVSGFRSPDGLEQGEIHAVEPRTVGLRVTATKEPDACQGNTAWGTVYKRSRRTQLAGLSEGCGIDPLVDVMGSRVDALSRDEQGGATKVGCGPDRAAHIEGEAVLQGRDLVRA